MKLPVLLVLAVGFFSSGDCQSLQCPKVRTTSGWLDLFPIPCQKNKDCSVMGAQHLCCKGFCTKGINGAAQLRSASSVAEPSTSTSTSTSSTSTTTTTTTSTTTTTTTTTTPSTTSTTTTTTTPAPTTTTSTEPPKPFLQILPIQTTPKNAPVKSGKTQKLVCPKQLAPINLFSIPCEKNSQCRASSGPGQVCCQGQCVKGVPAPVKEQTHQPILGVIPRECPTAPLGELLFEVQTCKRDSDCWPRVCCPDGTRSYCRTARARLDLVPVANRIEAPVRMLESYLQCTAPPARDLFPQRCSSSVDCFPNLCCAEGGVKNCRPPTRSLFALLAGVAQRFG